jgi:hypothetical protein
MTQKENPQRTTSQTTEEKHKRKKSAQRRKEKKVFLCEGKIKGRIFFKLNEKTQIKRTEENHLLIRCVQPVFSLPASFVGLLRSSSLLPPYENRIFFHGFSHEPGERRADEIFIILTFVLRSNKFFCVRVLNKRERMKLIRTNESAGWSSSERF